MRPGSVDGNPLVVSPIVGGIVGGDLGPDSVALAAALRALAQAGLPPDVLIAAVKALVSAAGVARTPARATRLATRA